MAAVAAEEKQLRALTRSSRSSSNSSSLNAGADTGIDKVTLSPVAAASIAGLPPQTSITVRITTFKFLLKMFDWYDNCIKFYFV